MLWLDAKQALFSCKDWALPARWPRYIQSVFNLIVNILMAIHVMVNWQLSKRVSADLCLMTVLQAQVYNSLRWHVFLKLSPNQLWVLKLCKIPILWELLCKHWRNEKADGTMWKHFQRGFFLMVAQHNLVHRPRGHNPMTRCDLVTNETIINMVH